MDQDYGPPTQGLPIASPANMLPVQVIRRDFAAPDAVTYHIVLPGTQQAPAPYLPGQFVTLALPTQRETLYRSYSLCGPGNPNKPWEITVKKMHMGAVSTYFYDMVDEGSLLYSSLPRGTFTLPRRLQRDMPLVFIAAGSGITPLFGMLRAIAMLLPEERPLVQLHYAAKSPEMMIYHRQLADLDPYETWLSQRYYFSSEDEHMTADAILDAAGDATTYAHWYMCGPEILKREIIAYLEDLRVPPERIHTEVFAVQQAPAYHVRGAPTTGGTVHIAATNATLDIEPQETLLAALERQGYRPNFSCRIGMCGACKLKVVKGQANPVGDSLSVAEREEGYVLSCIAVPMTSDITLESGGRPPAGTTSVNIAALAGGSAHAETKVFARLTAVLAVAGLLLGTWNLTDHKPLSWEVNNAAAPPASTATPGSNNGDTSGSGGGTGAGTATSTSQQPGGTTPAAGGATPTPKLNGPTATPLPPGAPTPKPTTPPAATATPKPAPKATSTPSPKH